VASIHIDKGLNQIAFQFDSSSFSSFMRSMQPRMTRYGLRILNDTYIIENIVQDAFLKLWDFRHTITSQDHAERFLKQTVKWECYAYFRNSSSRFHRQMIRLDAFNNCDFIAGQDSTFLQEDAEGVFESRLQEAWKAIAHLCYGREKQIMELHFNKGLNHKQIAIRYGLSIHSVTLIIEKCKLRLKTMLVNNGKRAVHLQATPDVRIFHDQEDGLTNEQSKIYQLRFIGKYSFEQIAAMLNMPVSAVQAEYVKAWKTKNSEDNKTMPKNQASRRDRLITKSENLLSA
jgi:RNA polymerase sigma factor (sigma-70 family)